MRLFGYYITHTVFNAIKKLFKTWIAFMLIVMVFGAVVGGIAGTVAASLSKDTVNEITSDEEVQGAIEETQEIVKESFFDKYDIEVKQIIELVISGVILFFIFLSLFSAKGMGDIFLPADVTVLFSAPLKPQSVMMFRLFTTIGLQIMFSIVMLFQIPNLVVNLKMSVLAAISIVLAWIILNLFVSILQLLVYILSSYSEIIKKNSKIFIGAMLVAIVGVFAFNIIRCDKVYIKAALYTFTGSNTHWIPFYGWIRGMCIAAIDGNNIKALIYMGLNIVGLIGLIVLVWSLKVDFYEDALVSAERRAEIIEKAKTQKTAVVRTKERSDKIKRDGFTKGSGANVFFYKTLYNRKRLSYFGFLTKTMILYIAIVAMAVIIVKNGNYGPDRGFLITCALMTLVAFYRTMGNPLSEDLSRDFFAMIPASARVKLFYSILGGITNTLMDIIVPFIFASVWFKASIGEAVVWLLFILAVELYGTIVGAFIMMSVSVSLPEMVQKMVQIIFVYFGIMPAIIFLVIGILLKNMVLFMPFGIVLNLGLSFIFFMIIPHFMQNGRK